METKINKRKRTVLCGCNRGVFESTPIRIVVDDPISFESSELALLTCLYCGRRLLLDLVDQGQPLVPAHGAYLDEAVSRVRQREWESQFRTTPEVEPK